MWSQLHFYLNYLTIPSVNSHVIFETLSQVDERMKTILRPSKSKLHTRKIWWGLKCVKYFWTAVYMKVKRVQWLGNLINVLLTNFHFPFMQDKWIQQADQAMTWYDFFARMFFMNIYQPQEVASIRSELIVNFTRNWIISVFIFILAFLMKT